MRIELVITEDNGRLHSHDFGDWNALKSYAGMFANEVPPGYTAIDSLHEDVIDAKLDEILEEALTPVKNNNIIETVKSWLK